MRKIQTMSSMRDPDEVLRHTGYLPFRVVRLLAQNGIQTLRELTLFTRDDIADIQQLGPASLKQLDFELAVCGLEWAPTNYPSYPSKTAPEPEPEVEEWRWTDDDE